MIYKKELLILISIIISTGAKNFTPISYEQEKPIARNVRKVVPLQEGKLLIKNFDFGKMFKNLRQNHSPEEVRIVGTLGLLSGALKVEEAMRENLYQMTDDLMDSFNETSPKENMHKLISIEETINRDKSAVSILNGMLQHARNITTLDALEKDMQHILHENAASSKRLRSKKMAIDRDSVERDGQKNASTGKLITRSGMSLKYTVKEKLYDVREMIDNHMDNIHESVIGNVKQTIRYIQNVQKRSGKLMKTNDKHKVKLDSSLSAVRRLWEQVASHEHIDSDFDVILNYNERQPKPNQANRLNEARLTKGEEVASVITTKPNVIPVNTKLDRFERRSVPGMSFVVDIDLGGPKMSARQGDNDDDNEIESSKSQGEEEMSEQNEEEFDESSEPSDQPGGLVGLITNLSGGDDGSDIGAVLGALSQVITNLLGPGGLDIPGLVASGSALLASLLSGDENFGKVLGNIFGLAIEGFSGGGGAANNGQFFGQFLGKFISILSADPDDDDAPLQPDTFIKSIFDGIGKGSTNPEEREDEDKPEGESMGSDSSGFIKGVISGLIHVITKASAGSSAGLSQGSVQGLSALSGGSSSGSSGASSKGNEMHESK